MELSKTAHEGFVITCDPKFPALKLIVCDGPGSVPVILRGSYTSVPEAKNHINLVLKEKQRKVEETKAKEVAVKEARRVAAKKKAALKKETKEREVDAAKDNTTSGSKSVRSRADNRSVAA